MKAKKRTFANCVYYFADSGYSWEIKEYATYQEMKDDFDDLVHSYAVAIGGQWVEIDKVQFDIFKD